MDSDYQRVQCSRLWPLVKQSLANWGEVQGCFSAGIHIKHIWLTLWLLMWSVNTLGEWARVQSAENLWVFSGKGDPLWLILVQEQGCLTCIGEAALLGIFLRHWQCSFLPGGISHCTGYNDLEQEKWCARQVPLYRQSPRLDRWLPWENANSLIDWFTLLIVCSTEWITSGEK